MLNRSGLHPHPGPKRGWYQRMVEPSDDEDELIEEVVPTPASSSRGAALSAMPDDLVEQRQSKCRRRAIEAEVRPSSCRGWYEKMVDPSDDDSDDEDELQPAEPR